MLFKQIKLRNILSFTDTTVELRGLNVLIGPNGVGKSNLVEVIGLLHAAPTDLQSAILQLGGIRSVLSLATPEVLAAGRIECAVALRQGLQYAIDLYGSEPGFTILYENLSSADRAYFERKGESVEFASDNRAAGENSSASPAV